jgi:tetratricopeptide (TPR) repeat protein
MSAGVQVRRRRIFVSSTIDDLLAERAAVEDVLASLGFFQVVRVENLPAVDAPSERVCLDEIGRADAVVLLLNNRYGFVPVQNNPESLCVTHLEYREARRLGRPVFAYIRRGSTPEPALSQFIDEVSDYHTGLFRRTWLTDEELRREVQRSAIQWLSAQMRRGDTDVDLGGITAELSSSPDFGQFPVDLSGYELEPEGHSRWLSEFLEALESRCRQSHLPVPVADAQIDHPAFWLRVRSDSHGPVPKVTLQVTPEPDEGAPFSPAVVLEHPLSTESAQAAAAVGLGLVFVGVYDAPSSLHQILSTSRGSGVVESDREALLTLSAEVSSVNDGESCHEILSEMLCLSRMASATVNSALLCLIAVELRYEAAGAARALRDTGQLALEFLLAALDRSDAGPELLYNLGRQSLSHSPELGLSFFERLVSFDPSYDERWYFHRDLGLIAYQANRFAEAREHYDRACRLKGEDSELWRQAGDARYYGGQWAEALLRYERAVSVEPIEECFLDFKIAFCTGRLAAGATDERHFERKFAGSGSLSMLGVRAADSGHEQVAAALFRAAKKRCRLNFDADRYLALFANRRGDYDKATDHLEQALCAIPEDPFVRLNLVANLVFRDCGTLGVEARRNARIALFHGGPELVDRFAVQLVNTDGREAVMQELAGILEVVAGERADWSERRRIVHEPEQFGTVIHMEFGE